MCHSYTDQIEENTAKIDQGTNVNFVPWQEVPHSCKLENDKDARWCAFAHDVPTRAHLHFWLICQPNEDIIKTDVWVLQNV